MCQKPNRQDKREERREGKTSRNRKVVIYSTCFVNFNKKETGVAALKVLKKNGVEVKEAYPGCCGMPFFEQANLSKVVEQAEKVSKDLLIFVSCIRLFIFK